MNIGDRVKFKAIGGWYNSGIIRDMNEDSYLIEVDKLGYNPPEDTYIRLPYYARVLASCEVVVEENNAGGVRMTLDEEIKHCEEVADLCEFEASKYDMTDAYESHVACQEGECAAEHRQLAEWLKELRAFKNGTPLNEVLDKIRAKIDKIYEREGSSFDCLNALDELKEFIDKYKGESER